MRRIAVIGPNPPCGALNDERFVEQLSTRLGLDAFALRPPPGLKLAAADAPRTLPRPPARGDAPTIVHVDADTLVWLRFSAGVYFRDWLAGWFDALLNGAKGLRRRARRASLLDAVRAFLAHRRAAGSDQVEPLRSHVLLVQLTSPQQARFWLRMQEERVRETLPPHG